MDNRSSNSNDRMRRYTGRSGVVTTDGVERCGPNNCGCSDLPCCPRITPPPLHRAPM